MVQVDSEIQVNSDIDADAKEQWSEVEKMVKDDDSWTDLSPKILYMVTMFHTGQIIIGGWIIWTLLNHKKWLMSRVTGDNFAVIVRSSVQGVVIQK